MKLKDARYFEPIGRGAMGVNCKLCWAPLVESEALKRKRWGYCAECEKVGSGKTVSGVPEVVWAEEWSRCWNRECKSRRAKSCL